MGAASRIKGVSEMKTTKRKRSGLLVYPQRNRRHKQKRKRKRTDLRLRRRPLPHRIAACTTSVATIPSATITIHPAIAVTTIPIVIVVLGPRLQPSIIYPAHAIGVGRGQERAVTRHARGEQLLL